MAEILCHHSGWQLFRSICMLKGEEMAANLIDVVQPALIDCSLDCSLIRSSFG